MRSEAIAQRTDWNRVRKKAELFNIEMVLLDDRKRP
jgi:hypothetical protein